MGVVSRPRGPARAVAGAVLVLCTVTGATRPAGAEATAATPVTAPVSDRVAPAAGGSQAVTPDIIPKPNSGRAPRDAGERGGWMQEGLFFMICGAIAGLGALAWRDSRRKRRRQDRPEPVAER